MGKSILFISGKGGVGKSTLASCLAVTAAKKGRRVALIDGDIGLRSLDLLLGLQDQVLYDMADLVARRCTIDQAMIWHPDYPDLCLMVGGQQAKPGDFRQQDLQRIVNTLTKRFDLVLIDGPAGLGLGVRNFSGLADEVVVVATPDPVSLRSAEKLVSQLYAQAVRPLLLLNRVSQVSVLRGEIRQPMMVATDLDMPLLGAVQESPAVYAALVKGGTSVLTGGDTVLDGEIADILARVLGEAVPFSDYEAQKPRGFQRFKQWLKGKA